MSEGAWASAWLLDGHPKLSRRPGHAVVVSHDGQQLIAPDSGRRQVNRIETPHLSVQGCGVFEDFVVEPNQVESP